MSFSDGLIKMIRLNNNPRELSYVSLFRLSEELDKTDDLNGVLLFASSPSNRTFLQNLAFVLFASPRLKKQFQKEEGYTRYLDKLVLDTPRTLSRLLFRQYDDYILFEFINRRYRNVIKCYSEKILNTNSINTKNDYEVLSFCYNSLDFQEEDFQELNKIVVKYPSLSIDYKNLFVSIDKDKQNEFYLKNLKSIIISEEVLKDLPPISKIEYFKANSSYDGILYIDNHFDEFTSLEGPLISYLFFSTTYYRRKDAIRRILSRFDDNEYLEELFNLGGY